MKIKELINKELDETAKAQAEWQAIVKRAIMHGWPDKMKIMAFIKAELRTMPESMVRRAVVIGLDWAQNGEV